VECTVDPRRVNLHSLLTLAMKMNQKYIDYLQKRIAESAIGASTLRNQGAPGVVEAARSYLMKIKLKNLSNIKEEPEYIRFLNRHTGKLKNKFHGRAKGNWGAARKALNIFIRDVAYNLVLTEWYGIDQIMPWLEVPLDNDVIKGIKKDKRKALELPNWNSIRKLEKHESRKFQKEAKHIGDAEGVYRVHLDLKYWRAKKREDG
jgi:hypothetical protein